MNPQSKYNLQHGCQSPSMQDWSDVSVSSKPIGLTSRLYYILCRHCYSSTIYTTMAMYGFEFIRALSTWRHWVNIIFIMTAHHRPCRSDQTRLCLFKTHRADPWFVMYLCCTDLDCNSTIYATMATYGLEFLVVNFLEWLMSPVSPAI